MQQALLDGVNKDDGRRFIGRFANMGAEAALRLHHSLERDSEAEPGGPNVPSPSQPSGRATAERPPSPVGAAQAEFVAALAGHPPRSIPIEADAIDLEDRAEHLSKVFGALSVYLAVILDDTAQNVPGRLDLPDVEAHLADLAADVVGLIERAAEDMRGWIA